MTARRNPPRSTNPKARRRSWGPKIKATRSCPARDHKARFATDVDAEKAIKRQLRRAEAEGADPPQLRAYPCPFCRGWHLTSQGQAPLAG